MFHFGAIGRPPGGTAFGQDGFSGAKQPRGLAGLPGLRFKTIQVDYAFASGGDLGQTHRFGLTFRFGTTPPDPLVMAQDWYQHGLKEYRRAHYSEALVDFNKALEIDPSHPEALKMMKKTYEQLKAITPQ